MTLLNGSRKADRLLRSRVARHLRLPSSLTAFTEGFGGFVMFLDPVEFEAPRKPGADIARAWKDVGDRLRWALNVEAENVERAKRSRSQ